MFRSLLYDHPQGSSFVLSALPLLRLLASSFAYSVCGRMPNRQMTKQASGEVVMH
jgi:hypothetical protein